MNNNNANNSNKNSHQQQQQQPQHHHHHTSYANEYSLFVGDLPEDCSDDKLQRLFQSKFKSVKKVQIIRHEDGKSRGFGFIRFEDRAEFQSALSQEMKIGARPLRLDTAHRSFKIRNRYSSINSTGSNTSHQPNHHIYNNNTNNSNNNTSSNNSSSSSLHHPHHHQHHHHNQSHHNHHHNQSHPQHGQQHLPSPQQQSQNNKTLIPDQGIGGQQSHHPGGLHGGNGRLNSTLHHGAINAIGPAPSTIHHHTSHPNQPSQQIHNPPHNAQMNHNIFNSSQQKNSQPAAGSRSPKQQAHPGIGSGGDEAGSHNKQAAAQPSRPNLSHQQPPPTPQPITQQNIAGNSSVGHAAANTANTTTTPTTAVTSLSSSTDVPSHPASTLVSNQPTINATGQTPIGPDYRAYAQSGMMEPHLMGTTDPASIVPQSSMYGHMYPYGAPPHFGYMPPPPQPNPVIPISAVPPLPPSQVSASSGVAQQHTIPTGNAARYGSAPHHGQQHMPDAMNHMSASVQAPPQAPFYYYYPSPFYFDQTGATAPPNMYHPQAIHPQFFALPNPAYMPNAHTYTNQHQTQPPPASQSDANIPIVGQQQPSLQQQSHPQQVNIRTRDIDAPIE